MISYEPSCCPITIDMKLPAIIADLYRTWQGPDYLRPIRPKPLPVCLNGPNGRDATNGTTGLPPLITPGLPMMICEGNPKPNPIPTRAPTMYG